MNKILRTMFAKQLEMKNKIEEHILQRYKVLPRR